MHAGNLTQPAARQPMPILRLTFCIFFLVVVFSGCDGENRGPDQHAAPEGGKSDQRSLISEADREYIWKIEHHANLLKEHGLSRLAEAVSSQDAAALQGMFPPDFLGTVPPTSNHGFRFQSDTFTVRAEVADDSHKSLTIERGPFVRWMLDRLAEVNVGDLKVRTHVITFSPVNPDQFNGRWSGTGKIEISSRGEAGALADLVLHVDFALDELDQERLARPGWLTSLKVTRLLAGKTRESLMRDATAERGIPLDMFWDNWKVPREQRLTNTGGVYLNDFNNDGLHDLFVTDLKASFMFVGESGGRFREATRELAIQGNLGGGFAAFVDLDGDGWEDLVHGIARHPDGFRIYRNMQGRSFSDVTERSNLPGFLLGMPIEEAREFIRNKQAARVKQKPTGLSIADYDLDGMVDLYVTRGAGGSFKSGSWIDGKAGKTANNQLLRNLGDWQFEDVTKGFPLDGGQRSTSNAVWLHADDDLRPDLYVIDEFGDGILLVNQEGGSFKGVELNQDPTDFGSMGMTAGDVDNDGHTDIYIAEMYSKAGERVMANIPPGAYSEDVTRKLKRLVDGSQLYLGSDGRKFEPAGIRMGLHAVGWAWGPCLVDLNNDGWLDLYATAGFISQERGKPDG